MFKQIMIGAGLAVTLTGVANADSFTGAGSTFAAPIFTAWAQGYKSASNNEMNYQAIGSGGGIRQIEAKTVDFGATDKPLQLADLNKFGLSQFPTVVGGIVPIVNLPGVNPGQLHLTGDVLANIFLGRITRWNDPQITRINPGVKLIGLPVTVVHRSDGSGTTFVFTSYLSHKSQAWANTVGANDSVNWKTGLGGKGNDGVAAFVKQTPGSIGYVEYVYARKDKVTLALVQNAAGKFPQPNVGAFAAAAASAPWGKVPGNYIMLVDQPGQNAWPISGATFVLVPRNPANPGRTAAVLRFFDWAYKTGDKTAIALDYVPLPGPVKDLIRRQWSNEIKTGGRPVYNGK
ncbi:phosphate ABC transporter substrate-binding protein PstS [Novosphingobium sp.]|uniref:phosphate ABC transporter substrate-binding protein PstS n=1 Tax=Novosphingobium sp. TaxID=1874826 RepID=UPI00333FD3B6